MWTRAECRHVAAPDEPTSVVETNIDLFDAHAKKVPVTLGGNTQGVPVDDLAQLTDQELVNEWAALILPAAGGVQPGRGSFGGRLDTAGLRAVTAELENRGFTELPGGVFESSDPDTPPLRPTSN